jgi:hypothetical protein
VRAAAGQSRGDEIIARHLADVAGHTWLKDPQRTSTILGYRPPAAAAPGPAGAAP